MSDGPQPHLHFAFRVPREGPTWPCRYPHCGKPWNDPVHTHFVLDEDDPWNDAACTVGPITEIKNYYPELRAERISVDGAEVDVDPAERQVAVRVMEPGWTVTVLPATRSGIQAGGPGPHAETFTSRTAQREDERREAAKGLILAESEEEGES